MAVFNQAIHAKMLIGGRWVDGPERIHNPANPDEVVGTAVRGTAADAINAIAAAKAVQPSWARRTFVERAKMLDDALDRFASGTEARARLYARENGRVFGEALGELRGVPIAQKLTLALAPNLDAEREITASSGRTFVNYMPYGVVVSIHCVDYPYRSSARARRRRAARLAGWCERGRAGASAARKDFLPIRCCAMSARARRRRHPRSSNR